VVGAIPKIRGLGQGNNRVWPHIRGMSPTCELCPHIQGMSPHLWTLPIVKHEVNVIMNLDKCKS